MARARSRGSGRALTTIARPTGLSIDAPAPCTARAATRTPMDGAAAQASDAAPNTTRPHWNIRRRPKRSANAPEVMSRLATTTV
jgi:hypothetical protein